MLIELINCKSGTEREIQKAILKLDYIKGVYLVTGEYDLIVTLQATTASQLQSVVLGKLRNIPNINKTVTLPVIEQQD